MSVYDWMQIIMNRSVSHKMVPTIRSSDAVAGVILSQARLIYEGRMNKNRKVIRMTLVQEIPDVGASGSGQRHDNDHHGQPCHPGDGVQHDE